jgi:uncharacterized protein (TIGR03382 family)
MRRIVAAFLLLVVGAARAEAQHFDLEMNRDSVKLGEVVELHARIHIGPQQTLASPVPVVAEGMPDGGRVVGVDSLKHQADRTLLLGTVRMAFLRTGRLRIPPLRVIVKATPDDRGFMLESEPLYVDVIPTLPAGNPGLKDIRDQQPAQTVDPLMVAAAVAALVALAWLVRRRLARRPAPVAVAPVAAGAVTAADVARAALARIEAEGWAERGDMDRYYDAIAAVMREYLGSIEPRVHAAQTSTEVLGVLAARRSNGTFHRTARLLGDADLVKFAGVSPDAGTARAYANGARDVIDAWARPGEPG